MLVSVFVSCAKGLEYLLEDELKTLGLHITRVTPQGVFGEASLPNTYQLCLWSRLASRIQVILFSGHAHNRRQLYDLCYQFDWQSVFSVEKTIAIEFHGASETIRNSMFGAQVVKDAIVDYFLQLQAKRPEVDRDNPEVLLHAHYKQEVLTISLDLIGYSMHQRGYRIEAGVAPLKENIAAAMLIRAKWPMLFRDGFTLHDPFCGSGTLVIEAAMMATNTAPGLLRNDQLLQHWNLHDANLWEKLRTEALQKIQAISIRLLGSDADAELIDKAQANAQRAGVSQWTQFETMNLSECKAISPQGLLIANPPYGERLGELSDCLPLYQKLGEVLHAHYSGWQAAILTSHPTLARAIGLRSEKQYTLYNGPIECKLYCISLLNNQLKNGAQDTLSSQAHMFANRLQKNIQHLKKWAKRKQVQAYRIYDADLPEYAYAIDIYQDYILLQEYAPPASVDPKKAEQRRLDVLKVVPDVCNIAAENIIVKQRKRQKGIQQYEKINHKSQSLVLQEGRAQLKVNLYDYLDTGLFLDHRLLRLRFAQIPAGTHFLNCFCYTATASVHAALAGCKTTNVDLSNTYLQWAKDNFMLNHLNIAKHQFIQADCLSWLKESKQLFDVIFLDPPSFSNSKRMAGTLDVQRDHELLIHSAMRLLSKNGSLYFSTNLRSFRLSASLLPLYQIKDISAETLDEDFKKNTRIHQCFLIRPTCPVNNYLDSSERLNK